MTTEMHLAGAGLEKSSSDNPMDEKKDEHEDHSDLGHKELYHMLLNLSSRDWEAIREAAHQMMGGSPSSMWHDEHGGAMHIGGSMSSYYGGAFGTGGAMSIGGGYHVGDLKDIVLTPHPASAARLLELEHDARGSGFKNALKHAWQKSKHLISKSVNYASNPKNWQKIYDTTLDLANKGANVLESAKGIPLVGDVAGIGAAALRDAQKIGEEVKPLAHHIAAAASHPKATLQTAIDTVKHPEKIKEAAETVKHYIGEAAKGKTKKEKVANVVKAANKKVKQKAEKAVEQVVEQKQEAPAQAPESVSDGGSFKSVGSHIVNSLAIRPPDTTKHLSEQFHRNLNAKQGGGMKHYDPRKRC